MKNDLRGSIVRESTIYIMGEAIRMSFIDDSCKDYRAMIEKITKNKITFSLSQSL